MNRAKTLIIICEQSTSKGAGDKHTTNALILKSKIMHHDFSCVYLSLHSSENFTSENPFHKIVYILKAALQLGHIAGPLNTFIMCHFIA